MAHSPYVSDIYLDAGHFVAPYRQSVNRGGTLGIPPLIGCTCDVTPSKSQTIRNNGK